MIQLFGIKNCDTVKKATKWLEQNNIDYTFHNFKTDGLSKEQLLSFADKSDWATLINKEAQRSDNCLKRLKMTSLAT